MACENTKTFRGAGEVFIATLDATTKLPNSNFRPLGNTPLFVVNTTQEFEDVRESKSGTRQRIAYITTSMDSEVSLELNSFSKENIEFAFYGTTTSAASGSIVGETAIVYSLNQAVILDKLKTSNVVVKNSLAATLTVDVDYTLDARAGTITFIDATNITIPGEVIAIDYDYVAQSKVDTFTQGQSEYALKMIGHNVTDGKAVRISIPRAVLSAAETLEAITDNVVTLAIGGALLVNCEDEVMIIEQED